MRRRLTGDDAFRLPRGACRCRHACDLERTIKVQLDRFVSISLMTVGMGIVALPALPWWRCPA